MASQRLENLRKKATKIDLNIAQLSRVKVKIDIEGLYGEVKQDLERNDFMDVSVCSKLFAVGKRDVDDEVDRLCSLGSLRTGRGILHDSGSDEQEEGEEGVKAEEVKRTRRRRKGRKSVWRM